MQQEKTYVYIYFWVRWNTGGPNSLHERGRLLAGGVVLQTVIYKGLYGIDRFFLKEIKNVMFLNKIDVPYCLVVFFVVCPRLRPF